jgi:tetratricopeptide (TPR) repeat protein
LSFVQGPVMAQLDNRPSELEINLQKIFIEANKEKILGRYEDAAALFKEVLAQDAKNDAALYELARMYDVLEKPDNALQCIGQALAIDPGNEWYRITKAEILRNARREKEAALVYEKLAKEKPENNYYYYEWAELLEKSGQAAVAVKVYDAIEKRFGFDEEIAMKRQPLYLGLNKPQKAIDDMLRLIKENPGVINYQVGLAELYTKANKPKEAGATYQKILQEDPGNPEANFALAKSYKEKGQQLQYLDAIKPIFRKADVPIDFKVKELLPYVQQFAQSKTMPDPALAQAVLQLAELLAQTHPEEAKSHSLLADVLFNGLGDTDRALAELLKTKELDNSVFAVWEQIMYIYAEKGDFVDLKKTTEESMDLFPNKAKTYYFNGIANTELGNASKAIASLEQCLLMSGRNSAMQLDVYERLGRAYAQSKQYDKADGAFEAGLKIDPNAEGLLAAYGISLAERGAQLDKAKQLAKKALDLEPNAPAGMEAYGWVLYIAKDYKNAKEWLGKSAQAATASVSALERYGDVLFQLGNKNEATAYWQKAIAKGGDAKRLNKKINTMKLEN